MTTFNHCRFCDDWRDQNLLRYGPRHYAHPKCWLDHKTLAELPWHQIEQMPFRLLKDRGLTDKAQRLIEEKNSPKTARQKRLDKIFAASA
jgi:hypothetical protein